MWLSGQSKPDHKTINDFRENRLKGRFQNILNQVVILLADQGVVSLKEIFVDGTKIDANADAGYGSEENYAKKNEQNLSPQYRNIKRPPKNYFLDGLLNKHILNAN